ncbi:sulfotransferase [Candidatus Pelagibacter sp.]|nr:sulfotransferase [Candidatus Pelagibacter sp.]
MTLEPKKNKQLFFLVAQPRSGNTLFTSIINQNPEIACTPNSITLEIMKDLFLLKQTDVFQNYPDHKSLDNVLDVVYDTYYKDWPQPIIIDRGPVMTEGNLYLMQKHFKRPFKCIVLLRDTVDVLASYMKWYTENPDAFVNKLANTDEEKLSIVMNKEGAVAKDLEAIKNSYNYKDICHYVKYDDLILQPEQEIRKVYEFMNLPYFKHSFQDLQQVEVNGMKYDDTVLGKNMHNIRSTVEKVPNPYIDKIPERIRQKYEHIRF